MKQSNQAFISIPIAIVLAVVAFVAVFIFSNLNINTGTEEGAEQMGEPQGEVREFTVEGNEFSFAPSSITVKSGDRVRITFKNIGRVSHNYVISKLGVATKLTPPGGYDTVEFTAPAENVTFESVCTVPGHKEAGMVGMVVVGE